jgi:hypothetical protein
MFPFNFLTTIFRSAETRELGRLDDIHLPDVNVLCELASHAEDEPWCGFARRENGNVEVGFELCFGDTTYVVGCLNGRSACGSPSATHYWRICRGKRHGGEVIVSADGEDSALARAMYEKLLTAYGLPTKNGMGN